MKEVNQEEIKRIIRNRKQAKDYLLSKKSEVYKTFIKLENVTFSDGKLSKKQKELIALGISIIINCESCMQWHLKQALDSGAEEQEIIETIEVAIEMGGGPATVSSRFAIRVLKHYLKIKE